MRINTRKFMNALLCCCFFVATGSADAANIRFFVKQSSGLYEIKGSTGGRFVIAPTGERINVIRFGTSPLILPVMGYTDRASCGDSYVLVAEGSGSGTLAVTYTYQPTGRTNYLFGPFPIVLPSNSGFQIVPTDPLKDNVTAVVVVGGRTDSRRLPIGTR